MSNQPEDQLAFDEDEDLFDFDGTASGASAEDEIDIAEFLSTIDDSDASAILDLAEAGGKSAASKDEAAAADEVAAPTADVATVPAGQQVVVASSGPFWKQPGALAYVVVGLALLLANVFGVWASWMNNRSMVQEVEATRLDIAARIAQAQQALDKEYARLDQSTRPGSATGLGPISFAAVHERLEVGDHAGARRLIYAKLALLDRTPADQRAEAEAHALFLLADADRAAADALANAAGADL